MKTGANVASIFTMTDFRPTDATNNESLPLKKYNHPFKFKGFGSNKTQLLS